jgi:hypothetical protein
LSHEDDEAWVNYWADREDEHGGFPGFSGVPRAMHNPAQRGEVIAYDAQRAVATVRLESGEEVTMHGGCYFSGRPARLPQVGDKILGAVKEVLGVNRIVVGRPDPKA